MNDVTVKISKYREVNKGFLKAFFTLTILPFGLEISDCKYFIKDSNRWFSFPSKEIKDLRDNQTKYIPLVRFSENNQISTALNTNVLDALKTFIPGDSYESKRNGFAKTDIQDDSQFIW